MDVIWITHLEYEMNPILAEGAPVSTHRPKESRAPAFLFVHGFLDSAGVWDAVRGRLESRGYATAAFDLRGHGSRSEEEGELSLAEFARDVGTVIDHLDRDIVLVGQSMGAQVAELAATDRPGRVVGLVLLTPVPLAGAAAPDEVVASFKALGGDPEGQRHRRQALSHDIGEEDLERLTMAGSAIPAATVARLVDVWNRGSSIGRQRSAYGGPTLVIRGVSDPFVGEDTILGVTERFAQVRSADVREAGHWAHVEQADEVASLLAEFVGALDSRGISDWRSSFSDRSAESFGNALAEDVILEASVLLKPLQGRETVKRVMEAASRVYETLTFTDSATAGSKQYVEWTAKAHSGVAFEGVTVLTRNEAGAIRHVAIHHRPLDAALYFSATLGETLGTIVPPGHFIVRPAFEAALGEPA